MTSFLNEYIIMSYSFNNFVTIHVFYEMRRYSVKNLLVKSTLGAMTFSIAVGAHFSPIDVKGYDSFSLVSDKAIAGMDISVNNLISAGGSDLYAYEMNNIITNSISADEAEDNNEEDSDVKTSSKEDTTNKDSDVVKDKSEANKKDNKDEKENDNKDTNKDKNDNKTEKNNKDDKVTEPEVTEVEEKSQFENVGISVANDYVNVRSESNTDSEIVGKLYRGCAATIIETDIKEADGLWTKIESGKVKGYIKKEYLAIGFDVEELVGQFGTKYATVNTTTLNVRTQMNTDCKIVTQIPVGESYEVIKEYKEWVEIVIDDDLTGYVSKEYVKMSVEFEKAISIKEEQEQLERERLAKEAQEEQERKLRQQQEIEEQKRREEEKKKEEANKTPVVQPTKKPTPTKQPTQKPETSSNSDNAKDDKNEADNQQAVTSSSTKGSEVASYALKFVGNRYVWGGTSLTNGTDCSGFTMSVYKAFGYNLPHHSGSQALCGKSVSVSTASLQPGDLLFYTNSSGTINHVTMYIGGGQVVHASNERDGIKVSRYNYRTPCCARRIIN